MEGKINKEGCLMLERQREDGPEMRAVLCPHAPDEYFCGDWCPKFSEPVHVDKLNVCLRICEGHIFNFSRKTFKDERIPF